MVERIRLSSSQVLLLGKAVDRLERAGPLGRPLSIARVARQGAAHFYLLRQPALVEQLRAVRSDVERDGLVAALTTSGGLAWFNVLALAHGEGVPVRLYAIREEGQNRELVEVEPRSTPPTA